MYGQSYRRISGIHIAEQAAGWQGVTKAANAQGGEIFLQLWHVGRVSHHVTQADGGLPVAPSTIVPACEIYTEKGITPLFTAREIAHSEMPALTEEFRLAAANESLLLFLINGRLLIV